MIALIFVIPNTPCNEDVNSICIVVPVAEFLLFDSAARRFQVAVGFEGKFYPAVSLLILLMRSLTIFESAGI